jgi:cell division protease FtsH
VLWTILVSVVVLLAWGVMRPVAEPAISYTAFLDEVRAGGIEAVTFRGNTLEFKRRRSEQPVRVYNPETDYSALIGMLQRNEVKISAVAPEQQSLFLQMLLSLMPGLLLTALSGAAFAAGGLAIYAVFRRLSRQAG